MNLRNQIAIALALCCSLTLACGGGSGGGGSASQNMCPEACARKAELACEAEVEETCVNLCQYMREQSCGAQFDALTACEAEQPASSFECTWTGWADLAADACDEEEKAFSDCQRG